jgi:hypothetical protein
MWQFNFKQSTWDKIRKENHQKRRANVFKCKLECTSGYPWRSDTIRPCLQARVAAFGSQDLSFRTSINGHWVWLSRPGFQDLNKRALGFTLRTWVSRPRKLSILRSSYLFPVTFLCVHRHFSLRPVVTDGWTDARNKWLYSGYPWRSNTIRSCLQARVTAFGS